MKTSRLLWIPRAVSILLALSAAASAQFTGAPGKLLSLAAVPRLPLGTRPLAGEAAGGPRVAESYGKLPLSFEPNLGQTDARVSFMARGGGMTAFFTDTETVMVLSRSERGERDPLPRHEQPPKVEQAVVRMKLAGAGQPRQASGLEKLPGISNYFIGNDPAKWRTDVPHYARIQYEGVYPGIDLVWYGNQRQLEYDFVVAPGADAEQIQVAYEGVESLKVEAGGELVLRTALGELRQQQPRVYQEIDGKRVEVGARYALAARNRVSFELAQYDRKRELRIDPVVLGYSTYLGGSGDDAGSGIALDAAGSAYVTGITASTNFPTQLPYKNTFQGGLYDVVVTKLTPAGNGLIYSTYLGGSGYDQGLGIAVDARGSAYVTGITESIDFPTLSAYQVDNRGGYDAFVTKLLPAGNGLVYSTFLGGSSNDYGRGIAVDAAGAAYVTGYTFSTDFPTQSQYENYAGADDAFVTKLSPDGTKLSYSTYLGGSGHDEGYAIAVDAAGAAYVTGITDSTNFPTLSAYQPTNPGAESAFVTKLSAAGGLSYSTYLGGSGDDEGNGIAVDSAGAAYVTGNTNSPNFPTQLAYQATIKGSQNAFVTKLTPAGSALSYSTYLGGSGDDGGNGIAVDSAGAAYVTGFALSADFPTQLAYQPHLQGGVDAFVTKLTPAGSALSYSTYLGGSGDEESNAIAVDGAGAAYVTGFTLSADFPTLSAYQPHPQGGTDAFVAKLLSGYPAKPILTAPTNGAPGVPLMLSLTWNASAEATSYDVYFDAGSPPRFAANTTNTGYYPPGLDGNTTYYWYVVAKNSVSSQSSDIWSFTTTSVHLPVAFLLVSPAKGATGVPLAPTLIWNTSTGATSYDIYFGTSSSLPLVGSTTGTSYVPGTLAVNTTYRWMIVANNSAGSTLSETWSFTTLAPPAPPGLVSPASGATGVALAPTLIWSASSGATSYDVHFGTASVPPLVTNTAGTNWSAGTLAAGTTYYWQVAAKNSAGTTSSQTWSFTTQASAPPAPVLTSPASGANGVSLTPTLAWSASSGATSYDVYFGVCATLPCSIFPPLVGNTTGTAYAPGTLDPNATYHWRIVAKNSAGSTSSATWLFTTLAAPPAPVLVSPANGATGVPQTTTLTWNASSGATSYDVYFGAARQSLATNTTGTSYSPGTLSGGATYHWRIVAKNSAGSTSSATWAFTTQAGPPAAPVLASPVNGATGVLVAPTLTWSASAGATSYDVYFGTLSVPLLATNTTGTSYAPGTLSSDTTYYWQIVAKNGSGSGSSDTWSFTTGVPAVGLRFVPVTPCRVADTRNPAGPFGGPTMTAGSSRSFALPQSSCGIPATAQAYSLNVTAVPAASSLGYLTLWPTGQPQPYVSTLNSYGGIVVANAAIVPAGLGAAVSVYVTDPTDVILDVNGYFDSSSGANAHAFYPATPCRVADTRNATGQFGGPSMFGGQTRDFPIALSACGIPADVTAYSLNVTALPGASSLGFLTTWPTGQARPNVSTLNSWTGKVVANAAIVPAGSNESISVFVTDPTDVILDINGYVGPAGYPGALLFYPVTSCRVVDTRLADGPFAGPEMDAAMTRSFAIPAGACNIPSTAAAYSLNVTVVPDGALGYLSAWPAGAAQPYVSTLNSWDGSVVANAAIVPVGTNGAVSIFVSNQTQVVLDINGYFAP